MKCPHCGADCQIPGRMCGNCGSEIGEFPGCRKECPSCHKQVIYGAKACPYCGSLDVAVEDPDPVLASHKFGPLAAPFQTYELKIRGDEVVAEQQYHLTDARRVTTVKRSTWRVGNVIGSVFFLAMAILLLYGWWFSGSGFMLVFGLMFGACAVYQLGVLILLESEASEKEDRKDGP